MTWGITWTYTCCQGSVCLSSGAYDVGYYVDLYMLPMFCLFVFRSPMTWGITWTYTCCQGSVCLSSGAYDVGYYVDLYMLSRFCLFVSRSL